MPLLIARFGVPPLIVTLGSLALFRGLAEGMTEAAVSYSGFPASLLFLGQGYLWGVVPAQLPVFVARGHASTPCFCIDPSSAARSTPSASTRRAPGMPGLPVTRRLALVYVLSGLVASLAAVVYVAHLGQARSDAGTGYELSAITAVVLGGTSVAGGRGSVWGTLLGLAVLAVLQNGLQLAALPPSWRAS